MKFKVIVATDTNDVLGVNGTIPWKSSEDLQYFRTVTSFTPFHSQPNILICGRRTWDSMKRVTLHQRTLFVVSRNAPSLTTDRDNVFFYSSFQEALTVAQNRSPYSIWVIGGKSVYLQALYHPQCGDVYWNRIQHYSAQTMNGTPLLLPRTNFVSHSIQTLTRNGYETPHVSAQIGTMRGCEIQYLRLMNDILLHGERRQTRNATTYSLSQKHLQWDLADGFPLLTTKRMFWKGIVEELLFFIRGDTQTKRLEEQGVNIWKGNTNRSFLDTHGFGDREEGDMGPMYGYQWRHFGKPMSESTGGLDQLKAFIEGIQRDPTSRRHLLTTYNPQQVHEGVLYPCHSIVIQGYIEKVNTADASLNLQMYQRSADVFLGLPFNIASMSLLCHILARLCHLKPGRVSITLGDAHIYEDHMNACKTQLACDCYPLPSLAPLSINTLEDVEQSGRSEYTVREYTSHPSIKANMFA